MTGLGDRLKEARTNKGFTLDDLQSITKIQKRYLSGIENEEYSMMPGSFYVRAFIKQYAEAVGLDADEMLLLYKENTSVGVPEEENQLTSPTLNRRRVSSNNRFNEIMPKITVALFIIVIIVVVAFLYKFTATSKPTIDNPGTKDPITMENNGKTDPGKVDVTDVDEPDKEVDEPDPDPIETPKQLLTHLNVNGADSRYSLEQAETFTLEIRTIDVSWIGILDETRKEWMTPARTLASGETVQFDVTETEFVRIRVGRTPNTEIYVNGELLEYANDTITQNIIIEYNKVQ